MTSILEDVQNVLEPVLIFYRTMIRTSSVGRIPVQGELLCLMTFILEVVQIVLEPVLFFCKTTI